MVRIYDFGEATPGVLFIAMELVPGRSLAAILEDEGALSVERAMHVVAQVCRGVAAAHAGFRRRIFRAVIAAAAITGGAMALDIDARNSREVIDRLNLAVDAIDLTIREHT